MSTDLQEQDDADRRTLVLATLARADLAEAEERLRVCLMAAGGWSEWEQRFVDFLTTHRGGLLLSGRVGRDLYFLVEPIEPAGIWLLTQPGGVCGKGLLGRRDLERLRALARLKGLLA